MSLGSNQNGGRFAPGQATRDPSEKTGAMATASSPITAPAAWPPEWGRWVLACTVAEVLGMAAASGLAFGANALVGSATGIGPALVVMLGALLGGAVEGYAVGRLQWGVLRTWKPSLPRRRYVGGTVALALCFWFLGMLPSTVMTLLGADAGTASGAGDVVDPPLLLVLAIAAAGGAVGGVAFGAVQGWALSDSVPHPWRWIRPNAVAWAIAVAVITAGAVLVPGDWPLSGVVAYGVGVGLLAGASVGVVTGQALPSLELALPWWNRIVAGLLLSPFHRVLSGSVVLLRFRGRRSGGTITLPVQYACDAQQLVVLVGDAERKTWWRNFADSDRDVVLRLKGRTRHGVGRVLDVGTPEHAHAREVYAARRTRVAVPDDATLVVIGL